MVGWGWGDASRAEVGCCLLGGVEVEVEAEVEAEVEGMDKEEDGEDKEDEERRGADIARVSC